MPDPDDVLTDVRMMCHTSRSEESAHQSCDRVWDVPATVDPTDSLHAGSAELGGTVSFSDVAGSVQFFYVTNNHFTVRKYFPRPMCGFRL